jgi:hypothetical protein
MSEGEIEQRGVLATFNDLDDLWLAAGNPGTKPWREMHDTLFGLRDLHGELAVLGARRTEFKKLFSGAVRNIDGQTVTSGHEAIAFFAGRAAASTGAHRTTVPRAREASATIHGGTEFQRQVLAGVQINASRDVLAKSVVAALEGWFTYRTWMRQCIAEEMQRATLSTKGVRSSSKGKVGIGSELVAKVRLIVRMGSSFRAGHPDWPDRKTRLRLLPQRLWEPLECFYAAELDLSLLRYEQRQAADGVTYNARADRLRAARSESAEAAEAMLRNIHAELATAVASAEAHLEAARQTAARVVDEATQEQDKVDSRLIAEWMATHAPDLRDLQARFSAWFEEHRVDLDGLGVDRRQAFGGRVRNSACEVLRELAEELVALLDGGAKARERHFDALNLTVDAWDDLLRAVRNETAVVHRNATGTKRQNTPRTPARRTAKKKQDYAQVLGSQQRTRLRRLAILRALPKDSNKAIVKALGEFGKDGPDDSTVSKDIAAMRATKAIQPTKLDRTAKGDAIVSMHAN